MIVIVLIGLIGGVVAYNVAGSLEEGKAFKTKQGASQLGNALMFEVASTDKGVEDLPNEWITVLETSPLVRNKGKDLKTDGWGKKYKVSLDNEGQLEISSEKYTNWYAHKHSHYDDDEVRLY